ncbi:hypothetical protein FSBG_01640 [Fusobacterium gonidiaformans 3-1-5R]|uniref:Peptidase S26 domain-containing protein n=2 Tax=Fusobacteriaceae TaxID=203492 RepID=E5BI20_9FUSO|nr:hypothetical protein FSBG_01640 [Fusobacterium gonidiaformans 3-1-5R]
MKRRDMRKKYVWFLFLILVIGTLQYKSRDYTINITRSLPLGIYHLEEASDIQLGDIVQFQLEKEKMDFLYDREYLPRIADTLLKIVAADSTNSEKIRIQNNSIFPILYIGNHNWGPILPADSKNRVVPQISLEEMKPKEGEYLLLSPVARSFDGRYWGSISKEKILKKATPILIF